MSFAECNNCRVDTIVRDKGNNCLTESVFFLDVFWFCDFCSSFFDLFLNESCMSCISIYFYRLDLVDYLFAKKITQESKRGPQRY